MEYLDTKQIAEKWGITERAVRKYCAEDRIEGAKQKKGIWLIPEDAEKPERMNKSDKELTLLQILRREDRLRVKGGIYHKVHWS